MAGNRAAGSRTGAPLGSQRDQLVMLGSAVALGIAAIIVLVGLYLTVYRPPREHVLTAGDARFDAGAVVRRGVYLMLFQPDVAPRSQSAVATTTLDVLQREELLRTRSKGLVPEVTAEDITKTLQLEIAPPPRAPEIPNPVVRDKAGNVIGTAVPVNSPTPTPTVDSDVYTKGLAARLDKAGASKAELDAITSAKLYEQRLIEKFKGDAPKTLPQVQLVTARIQDQATADRVRAIALRPGVDFGPVASQNSVSDRSAATAGTPTWVIVDELDAPTRDVVKGMKAGDVSAVIPNGTYYDVYKVIEVSAARDLDDDQKTQLAKKKLEAWLADEAKQVKLERDLTTKKEQWITDHVVSAYQKASATPRAN